MRRRMLFGKARLPAEYQEVEWIESHGTEYIDTLVIPDNKTGVKLCISVSNTVSDLFRFGCRQDSGNTRFIIGTNNNAYVGFGIVYGTAANWRIYPDLPFTTWLNYKNDRKSHVDNGMEISLNSITFNFTYSLLMFGRNVAGSITKNAQRMFECEITYESTVIRNFVPCYRKSDSEIGMYDLVNSVFYTNQGTGTFEKGADV